MRKAITVSIWSLWRCFMARFMRFHCLLESGSALLLTLFVIWIKVERRAAPGCRRGGAQMEINRLVFNCSDFPVVQLGCCLRTMSSLGRRWPPDEEGAGDWSLGPGDCLKPADVGTGDWCLAPAGALPSSRLSTRNVIFPTLPLRRSYFYTSFVLYFLILKRFINCQLWLIQNNRYNILGIFSHDHDHRRILSQVTLSVSGV